MSNETFSLDDFIKNFSKMKEDDQRDIIMGDHDITDAELGPLEIVEDKVAGFQDATPPVRVQRVEKTVIDYVPIKNEVKS